MTYYQVLEKIAENLSHTYIRTNSFTPRLAALIAICFDAGLISLGILGFALTFIDNIEILDLNEWIIKTCIVGAITSGLWFLLLIKYFRHTSWICWVLADFILVGIAGFILSTLFIIRDINLDLPQPAPTLYFEPIVNKTCTLECSQRQGRRNHSRSYVLSSEQCASSQNRSTAIAYYEQMNSICMYNTSFFFYLDIADWRSKGNYHFSVQEAQYDQSQLGNKVRVPVYPGALGIHWLSHPQLITITESFD